MLQVSRTEQKKTQEPPSVILNESLKSVEQASLALLGNRESLRKVVRRKRLNIGKKTPNPQKLAELRFPPDYTTYQPSADSEESELFLLADNGKSSDRIVVFGRESWVPLLDSDEWFCDGTFSITPALFAQVFVILVRKVNIVLPVIYALLPDKKADTYSELLRMVKNLGSFNPSYVNCDYELAIHNAFRTEFPTCQVHTCFFHLANNLQKFLACKGYRKKYQGSADFVVKMKSILALAFVKPENVYDYFETLEEILSPDEIPALQWFEDYYIGRLNRQGRRRPPIFLIPVWNVYERVLNDCDRTNNHAEAAHRKLSHELGVKHQTLWKFIDSLRVIQ